MAPEQIAQVCYEVDRALCATHGDTNLPTWSAAPAAQRDSVLAKVRLHLADPKAGPDKVLKGKPAESLDTQVKEFIFRALVLALADGV